MMISSDVRDKIAPSINNIEFNHIFDIDSFLVIEIRNERSR